MLMVLLIAIPIALVIMAGWLVPLVIGIKRRRANSGGTGLIILSCIWGFLGLFILPVAGLIGYGVCMARQYSDVETFDAQKYSGKTGNIVLSFKGDAVLTLQDTKKNKMMRCSGKEGTVTVPPGAYRLIQFEGSLMDEQNVKWHASAHSFLNQINGFTLQADGTHQIEVGPPFVARITAKKKGNDKAEFNLEMAGRGGGQYTISRSGGTRAAPGFEVVSKAGESLWKGKFEFG